MRSFMYDKTHPGARAAIAVIAFRTTQSSWASAACVLETLIVKMRSAISRGCVA
jgi:hypothetical protein